MSESCAIDLILAGIEKLPDWPRQGALAELDALLAQGKRGWSAYERECEETAGLQRRVEELHSEISDLRCASGVLLERVRQLEEQLRLVERTLEPIAYPGGGKAARSGGES